MVNFIPGYDKMPHYSGYSLQLAPLSPGQVQSAAPAPAAPLPMIRMPVALARPLTLVTPTAPTLPATPAEPSSTFMPMPMAPLSAPSPVISMTVAPSDPTDPNSPLVATPTPPLRSSAWIQRGIVYGGVPLCALIFLKYRGLAPLFAGLLGAGIAGTYFMGGFTEIGGPNNQG